MNLSVSKRILTQGYSKFKTNSDTKSVFLLKVKLIVKWELKDDSGNNVFCIEVPAQVTS